MSSLRRIKSLSFNQLNSVAVLCTAAALMLAVGVYFGELPNNPQQSTFALPHIEPETQTAGWWNSVGCALDLWGNCDDVVPAVIYSFTATTPGYGQQAILSWSAAAGWCGIQGGSYWQFHDASYYEILKQGWMYSYEVNDYLAQGATCEMETDTCVYADTYSYCPGTCQRFVQNFVVGPQYVGTSGSLPSDAIYGPITYELSCTGTNQLLALATKAYVTVNYQPCPAGTSGTYPNCVPTQCPAGKTGTYPNCVDICNTADSACGEYGTGLYDGVCSSAASAGWRVVGGQWQQCTACVPQDSASCGAVGTAPWAGICATEAVAGWEVRDGQWRQCGGGVCANGSGLAGACVSCNSGYRLSEGTCVPNDTPCPSGYTLSGGACIADTCSNGLNRTSYPSCTCPSGQVPSGSICVSPSSCSNGLNRTSYPTCTCPSGEVQSGSACVVAATADFNVSPARVRKNDSSVVSWNTTGYDSCRVADEAGVIVGEGLSSAGVSVMISAAKTFTLSCTKDGDTDTWQKTVTVVPVYLDL